MSPDNLSIGLQARFGLYIVDSSARCMELFVAGRRPSHIMYIHIGAAHRVVKLRSAQMTRRIGTMIGIAAGLLLLAILAGVVGLLYARPATAQTNVGVPGMRQVSVAGHGEVKGRPDTAMVQIGVENEAATAKEALAQNTAQAQALQQKLKELGVAEK